MTTTPPRQLHLNVFVQNVGHHESAWRLPESDPCADVDIDHYVDVARTAERGLLDSVFLADLPKLATDVGRRPSGALDPLIMLGALATATHRIGLIATASTSYNQPYNLARRFATLDHVSHGRVGWNIVTTAGDAAARNFGQSEADTHADRYLRAAEFVELLLKLWDSWETGAVTADKARGVWGDNARIHAARHEGRFYRVAGALNVPRSPQGHPVLVQAGSSPDGRAFAARFAEAVFTAQQTLDEAQAFYADIKARSARIGRDPEKVKVLPGLAPVIGATEAEARAKEQELDDLILPDYAKQQLARRLKLSPDQLDLDRELPVDLVDVSEIEDVKSRFSLVVDLARRERLTVRQLIRRLGGGRGHRTLAGTPEQIADSLEQWFLGGAADGFNIMPSVLPGGLRDFVDHVVPVLQARGLFRKEYTGTTLRDHYGLDTPSNAYEGGVRVGG